MNAVHARYLSSPPPLLTLKEVNDVLDSSLSENPVLPTNNGDSSCSSNGLSTMQQEGDGQQKIKRRRRQRDEGCGIKICAVCGDFAKNVHFGGVSCDSCKAFFRRSVQSTSFTKFKCSADENCPIIKNNRRLCQYCRFKKCQSVGMEVSSVMSEAERIALWRKKIAKHRDPASPKDAMSPPTPSGSANSPWSSCPSPQDSRPNSVPPSPSTESFFPRQESSFVSLESSRRSLTDSLISSIAVSNFTAEEIKAIKHLVTLQVLVFSSMPYPRSCVGNTTEALANLFFCICEKLRCFFFRIDDFHELSKEDQIYLLRNGIAMSIYIHGAYNYDSLQQTWPAYGINDALRLPSVTKETLKRFTIFPDVYVALMNFYNEYGSDMKDEGIVVLLCLIALFHDGESKLKSRDKIGKINNRYISLLRNYLIHKRGTAAANNLVSKLLQSLYDIKRLVSFHTQVDMKPSVITESQPMEPFSHINSQMEGLTQLLKGNWNEILQEHSSVFSPEERIDLELADRQLELSFRRPQMLPDPRPDISNKYWHHKFTDLIFGAHITTNKFFHLPNIFKHNPHHLLAASGESKILRQPAIQCSQFPQLCDSGNNSINVAEKENPKNTIQNGMAAPGNENARPLVSNSMINQFNSLPIQECPQYSTPLTTSNHQNYIYRDGFQRHADVFESCAKEENVFEPETVQSPEKVFTNSVFTNNIDDLSQFLKTDTNGESL